VGLLEAPNHPPQQALSGFSNTFSRDSVMELVLLVLCAAAAWVFGTTVDSLPGLGLFLVPSPWLLGGLALVAVTWLMGD
jgi:hypothetical protein